MKQYVNYGLVIFISILVSVGLIGCSSTTITKTLTTHSTTTLTSISTTSTTTSSRPVTSNSSTPKSAITWNLKLTGAITQDMSQSIFEAGAAPGCHGINWTDSQGHIWSGIPLWYLVGYVDDKTTMGFNDALADKGYVVYLIASDGSTVSFTSAEVKRNNNFIVAYLFNGQPLSNILWPLALVGNGVDQQHQIGMITAIKLIFPSGNTTTPLTNGR